MVLVVVNSPIYSMSFLGKRKLDDMGAEEENDCDGEERKAESSLCDSIGGEKS